MSQFQKIRKMQNLFDGNKPSISYVEIFVVLNFDPSLKWCKRMESSCPMSVEFIVHLK